MDQEKKCVAESEKNMLQLGVEYKQLKYNRKQAGLNSNGVRSDVCNNSAFIEDDI